ncbi:4-hydroxythreonine-4-phosphate dehydrogenase PdxA [Acetivibrio mesophilus]|uniref:4-hydroxythreonine-4-phosphate dehydrogenase PdxA n=1 Tax=Acetivibrio mesophilus TaxID=2487273 RepID=A0A4Q0I623_9FIRM|nr:4-hydroxythreonine-4-phosphate dehydrogenase PdxA [Acetivibrio mesophilus]ODM25221.1 4-hydroxythreonine-4-phosphate dehydrogenase PdxA [Clostridium sp. Bc-iso-3]RXE59760.1 4-hydroxythreonine-4-phosphate dehydrogenase PdxA [Acetivibrio mesophilus]HHV29318.1 4-hydroxythreonine-4-phosphate dehydrogenase PdxA [Clostridium sp.]
MDKPTVGIPLGDIAGIGPEIVVKALKDKNIYRSLTPVVIGARDAVRQALEICELDSRINVIDENLGGMVSDCSTINLIDTGDIDMSGIKMGQVQEQCGRAAFDYIKRTVKLAMDGRIDAVATTPINKESLKMAGVDYIGHTEILAGLTDTKDPLTMFEVQNLRIFFLSRHVSLRQACDLVTKERVLDYIERCTTALRLLGINEGTMAVAGLNPHSGEHGLFGNEETYSVVPAVKEAALRGYSVEGPIGADSVFYLANIGRYNSVLSLYHDQGHIAAKTLDFEKTIAVTIGLPFLRTSVDHGTAFDIAGTGKASAVSMVEALLVAGKYARSYKNNIS